MLKFFFFVSRYYLGSDTPAAMTWTAMTMRVSSRVTVSNSSHPEGSKMLIAYGPMMMPNAVATTSHEEMGGGGGVFKKKVVKKRLASNA